MEYVTICAGSMTGSSQPEKTTSWSLKAGSAEPRTDRRRRVAEKIHMRKGIMAAQRCSAMLEDASDFLLLKDKEERNLSNGDLVILNREKSGKPEHQFNMVRRTCHG